MSRVRPPAVAGSFYHNEKNILSYDIESLLDGAHSRADKEYTVPKAMIVPHAGYIYSGPVAASAYRLLEPVRDRIKRVVLLGPVHRVPVIGLALPVVNAFQTPLGEVAIDADAVAMVEHLDQVVFSNAAHAQEHSLEVQLPFLQTVLDNFTIVPFAVGNVSGEQVAEVLDTLWGGDETLIVISSDLSHFHPYQVAHKIDTHTVEKILDFQSNVSHEQACGGTPVNGLLIAAQKHKLKPQLLDLRNSGDTAGDKSRVVGYASFAFTEDQSADLDDD